jgi:hypothetical protein
MTRHATIIAYNERHVNRGAEATKDCYRRGFVLYSVDRNGSLWIARSTAFLPDGNHRLHASRQEQTAVY